ncbi:MAG TPA: DUF4097 family beta strand repeat-containing protein [Cyclobacteriaceae bacterium]|nr:DUF4097 family beta strand repeat-containing protein [Cyclobacteriaceae bacterium]
MKKIVILAVFALISAGTIYAQTTVNKTFTGVKRIRINTASGDCEIKKGTGSSVEVELKHSYDEGSYTPRFDQSGDRLTIGETHGYKNHNGGANWKITVPDGIEIDFSTGSGNLAVNGLTINVDARTGSGDIQLAEIKGDIDASTGSGNIEMNEYVGRAKLNTGSGTAEVSEAEGELDLNCGSGNIRLSQCKAYFRVNTGSGSINAEKITLSDIGRFNTGSGRAKVTLAATPKFDIAVNSGSGDAELNFGGNEIVGEIIMKASKNHGRITAPFEFDNTREESYGNGRDNVTIVKTAKKGNGTNRIEVSTGSGDAILRK